MSTKYAFINYRALNPKKANKEFTKLGIPLFTQEEKTNLTFKERLQTFFIKHGSYKITDKAFELPAVKEKIGSFRTKIIEGLDQISSRDNDLSMEYVSIATKKEMKIFAESIIGDIIQNGEWKHLVDEKAIMPHAPNRYWLDKENRTFWTKKLVDHLKKSPRDMFQGYFIQNGLSGMIDYYGGSGYKAIVEAYPELKIRPWEMLNTPIGTYQIKKNRVGAIKWLCKQVKKDSRKLIEEDFANNRLLGLLDHYKYSIYAAVCEAYPKIKAWERDHTPSDFYEDPQNRIDATKKLVKILKKDPRELRWSDFQKNGFIQLLKKYGSSQYGYSAYLAVNEAYPELDIKPWQVLGTYPGIFKEKKMRIAAVKWLANQIKKEPTEWIKKDFVDHGLFGLVATRSVYKVVSEVYPEIKRIDMAVTPNGTYKIKKNRVAVIKILVEKLKKDPRDLKYDDFLNSDGRAITVLNGYYRGSPYLAVREAYPELKIKRKDMLYDRGGNKTREPHAYLS